MRKKLLALVTILALGAALSGCGEDYSTVFTEVNTVEGVTLTLQEDTLKASKASFLLRNDSEVDAVYDPVEFHLEEKKDETWQESVGTRVSEWKRDRTEELPAGSEKQIEVDWKGLCGAIGSGEYRVIVIVNDQPVAAEFTR